MGLLLKSVLIWVLSGALARLLAGAGLAIVTYAGIQTLWNQLEAALITETSGLPAAIYQVLDLANVWSALGVVLSAMSAVIAIRAARVFFGLDG